jgi:hypothetical protein
VQLASPTSSGLLGRLETGAKADRGDRARGGDRGGRAGRDGHQQLLVLRRQPVRARGLDHTQDPQRLAAEYERHEDRDVIFGGCRLELMQPIARGQPTGSTADEHLADRRTIDCEPRPEPLWQPRLIDGDQLVRLGQIRDQLSPGENLPASLEDQPEHVIHVDLTADRARDRLERLEPVHGTSKVVVAALQLIRVHRQVLLCQLTRCDIGTQPLRGPPDHPAGDDQCRDARAVAESTHVDGVDRAPGEHQSERDGSREQARPSTELNRQQRDWHHIEVRQQRSGIRDHQAGREGRREQDRRHAQHSRVTTTRPHRHRHRQLFQHPPFRGLELQTPQWAGCPHRWITPCSSA